VQNASYTGLFYETNAVRVQSSGAFNLSVTAGGKYSGALQMSAGRLPFSGQFGVWCQATNNVARKKTNALVLSFGLGLSNQVVGSVSDGIWIAYLYAEQTGFHPTTNSAPYAGQYTMMFRGDTTVASSLGSGFGTFTLSTAGAVHFAGTLADGTKLSQSALVSQYGNWPFFVPLYSGKGLVISWLAFSNLPNGDLSGAFNWIKPANSRSLLYQNGLAVQRNARGSFYVRAANPMSNAVTANLWVGGLAGASSSSNQIIALKFSPTTGTFSGKVQNETLGKPTAFQGAFLQKGNAGFGFVLGTNASSPVILTP
jgi:hypothetical protein